MTHNIDWPCVRIDMRVWRCGQHHNCRSLARKNCRRTGGNSLRQPLSRIPADQERKTIEAALADAGGRVSGPAGAAAKLGIPGSTLESKIKSLKINKNHFKTRGLPTDRV